jgi:hypothetical protein
MQTLVDLPTRTGANPKHPIFSVKRTSVAALGEAADLVEASVSE